MTEFPQSRISSAEGSSMFTYYTRKNSACKLWITNTGVVSRQLPLCSTAALAAVRAMSLVPVAPLRKTVGLRAWTRRGLRVVEACPERSRRSISRITDCLPCRSGPRRQVDLTLPASTSSRLSFVCVAVSETLQQLRYEQHGLSAPARKRTHRAGDVLCVPYAAACRANRSCIFYRQDHRQEQRRQLPMPLQFLLARDQVPYATGI